MGNSLQPLSAAHVPTAAELSVYEPENAPFSTHLPDSEGAIRFAQRGPGSAKDCPAMTVPQLFAAAVKKHGHHKALFQEDPERTKVDSATGKAPPALEQSQWLSWTWKEYHDDVQLAARALITLGFEQHDACTIFGYNSPQWFIAAMSAMAAGGKCSGVYPSDTAEQFQYKAHHSHSSILLVESNTHLALVSKIIAQLPYVKAIVVWTEPPSSARLDGDRVPVLGWKEFLSKANGADSIKQLEERNKLIRPGHACSLIYTSGTTGQPKAVMVSHDNLVFEATTCLCVGVGNTIATNANMQERILSYLPLSHVAGQMLDILAPVAISAFLPGYCSVYFARSYDLKLGTLVERLRVVKPTLFLGVPRVWEKVAEKMKQVGAKVTGTKKKIATWAKAKGLAYQTNIQLGGNGKKPTNYALANKLVLANIKIALGLSEVKVAMSGAAPMTMDTLQYFGQLGFCINELYGLSESSAATTWSNNTTHTWGSVGFALPGMEVKMFQMGTKIECPRAKHEDFVAGRPVPQECQGELCIRGRHVMIGYMANPALGQEHVDEILKKNAEAIDSEGWFHSGDKATITDKGMISITGRYKEILVTAGGENVAPIPIEDEIKKLAGAVISNVQLIGDKRKFITCLITLKCKGASGEKPGTDELEDTFTAKFPGLKTIADATASAEVIAFIDSVVQQTNKNGDVCPSTASRIGKYTILPHDFSVETEELTATLKLKRSVVEQKHKKTIDAMYEGEGKAMFFPFVA